MLTRSISKLQTDERRKQNLRPLAATLSAAVRGIDVIEPCSGYQRREAALDDPVLSKERSVQHAEAIVPSNASTNVRLKKNSLERVGMVKMQVVQIRNAAEFGSQFGFESGVVD